MGPKRDLLGDSKSTGGGDVLRFGYRDGGGEGEKHVQWGERIEWGGME